MVKHSLRDRSNEKGFTLVELAVVMIIIGLLIGGILKGQELIANAEVAATISQLKGVDAAVSGFRDKYGDFPGDMDTATTRLPGGPPNGDGLGELNTTPGAASAAGSESDLFWQHLDAANFLSGDQGNVTGATIETRINNANIGVGYTGGGAVLSQGAGVAAIYGQGHYMAVTPNENGSIAAGTAQALKPDQAGRIDRKVDNGDPGTGTVTSAGTGGGTGCHDTAAGTYREANTGTLCSMYMQFQS